jgi:site-specific DNA-methyltransferase (adenine-specific)
MINLHNVDCLEFMKGMPDKAFDLAIVDPPYGLGQRTTGGGHKSPNSMSSLNHHAWDFAVPPPEYFAEVMRVSQNQIVWGGNYFGLPAHRTFIVWDKMTYPPTMSQVEQAWTSFDEPARLIQINSNQSGRIHPTQKPVALYRWLLQNYAKPGWKILDTHGGSMSSAIACDIEGYDLDICELDKDYFEAGKKRFEDHMKQPRLFDTETTQAIPQPELFTESK